MALDTLQTISRAVQLRCPSVGAFLARQWTDNCFRDICARRLWSWKLAHGQFLFPALYNTGTVTVTRSSNTVTGAGTTFTGDMEGRQFRLGVGSPIYTITDVPDATTLTLDAVYASNTLSGQNYQIYAAYQTVPTNFLSFTSIIDPRFAWKLWANVNNSLLDLADPQRANAGQPYIVSPINYDTSTSPPTPRMEIWPHVQQQYYLTYMYEIRPDDLTDANGHLPRTLNGNIVLEKVMAQAAKWPGASPEAPNPYFNLNLSILHDKEAERMIAEAERNDDEITAQDLMYATEYNFQMCPWPLDSRWLQSHGVVVY